MYDIYTLRGMLLPVVTITLYVVSWVYRPSYTMNLTSSWLMSIRTTRHLVVSLGALESQGLSMVTNHLVILYDCYGS